MKKTIFICLIGLVALTSYAQDDMYFDSQSNTPPTDVSNIPLTDGGAYEKKEVVQVEGATASVLFSRAMEALSDWSGPDGKAKAGIDYHDKESGTVIYKGTFSLGFKNVFLGDGWNRYANFTLKTRCKDGRAQVTVTVPTITAVYTKNALKRESSTKELLDAVLKSKGNKRERGEALMADLTGTVDLMVAAMAKRLREGVEDEDF